ncbi:DHA2 family efflux MFS transporter permease subunit [Nocardioides sp. dk4132]|uniref:MDR family MFS transporter n=1 Tax=unclassified Nocardioides TaxID=2615069 RepID=UPI0012962781|nr:MULTISPECIES: MDR family MFS transporter [unclassified Nocardioides]MQW77836.1 DHA2 family efflux MFS transporter permease subunit [Nocardioides sp. dk4132]QGA08228.1 DHA2 family efflux MFS transporter permease subunit [Nocardioides sp. dk884]
MTSPAATAPADHPRPSPPPDVHVGRLIALLVGSAFVLILNETIMSVALPELMGEFSVAATSAQWLTTAFLLTMAIVIPVTGYLLRRFTLRQVFLAAMVSFVVGTALAGAAPTFSVLLAARVIQAVGTALVMPLLMTTILNVVEPDRRGRMMGTISIVISVAPAVGPTVSGVILDQLDWRWMFWLVLPFALLALVLGAAWVRNVTEPVRSPIDVLSVALSALGFGGLVYGLSSIGESAAGHAPVAPWIPLTIGAVALAVFVWRQLALRDRALLDLRAFASRTFSIAVVLVAVSMMALFGSLILLPLYLQSVLGLSTLDAGLILLPGGLTMGLLAPFVGRVFDRVGPRPLVAPGAAIASVALWSMTTFDTSTGQGTVVAVHVLLSVGLALMLTPLMTSALGSLPQHLYAHGSAIVSTLQQVAGAAGTAIFITVMTRGQVAGADNGLSLVDATADGIHNAFMYGGVISAVAVLIALAVRRPAAPAHS